MIWAKTAPVKSLLHHMLDTGNMAYALLSESTVSPSLDILSTHLHGKVIETVCCLVALHDIGKCHPYFQMKAGDSNIITPLIEEGLLFANDIFSPPFRHEIESEKILRNYLKGRIENRHALDGFAKIAALHHQPFSSAHDTFLNATRYAKWNEVQLTHINQVCEVFEPDWRVLNDCSDLDACCSIIWGLMMLSDWLSSGQEAFMLEENNDIEDYRRQSADAANAALRAAGFSRAPLLPNVGIQGLFPEIPVDGLRPVQMVCEELRTKWQNELRFPIVTIIEAPMGEGKTEAALSLASSLMHGFGKSGCYFALPTAATSNCMFDRINKCFLDCGIEGTRLLHGHAWLLEEAGFGDHASREAQAWLAPMRRAILSPYGVGTVDQALMSVLRIRYTILRLIGLSEKVLIIDEIHAYDAYMQQALTRLLSWARVLQIPMVLLSATLPSEKRKTLLQSIGCKDETDGHVSSYPLITQGFMDGKVEQTPVSGTYMQQQAALSLKPWMNSLAVAAEFALSKIRDGGCAGILVNTVAEAQEMFEELARQKDQETEIYLFHARFPLLTRQKIEGKCVSLFGKKGQRPKRAVLVATQVVEQSIDLDMDFLITMLCPIDLLLQRMGRMHRHKRQRPGSVREPEVVVLTPESEAALARTPTTYVYSPWILRNTWQILAGKEYITLPDDIRPLVETAYTASAPGNVDFEEWMTMTFRNDVMAEAARSVTFPSPRSNSFFMAEGSDVFTCDEENGAVIRGASTRYDENITMQIAMVTEDELGYADECSASQAREVLMRAVSVPRYWIDKGGISGIEGRGMLRGVHLILASNGVCRGSKWLIRSDDTLGLMKEDL